MTAFGIYTAPTKGWKKLSLSYAIKLFTYFHFTKEAKEYFKIKGIEDTPTHAVVYGEFTETGERLIFEANKTMELNYLSFTYGDSQNMMEFGYVVKHRQVRDLDAFKRLVKNKANNLYGFWEWLNYIRRALWWWIFRRDIKGTHQYFAWLDVCSELVARDMMEHNLPKVINELSKINFNVISPVDLLNIAYIGIKEGEIID